MFDQERNPLWVERFRPAEVKDCILPGDLKATFQQFVDAGSIPNMTLVGGAGCGKTTVAKAMLDELNCDYIVINGSLNGNIDTLRNEIQQFASSVSLTGGRKYVILDEADGLNPSSTMPALRNFIEQYSRNCGFILTANFAGKIIEPLKSRCPIIEMKFKKSDMPHLATEFFKRAQGILSAEGVEYETPALAGVIGKYMPDWRRVLGELQRYGASGKIDAGILTNIQNVSIVGLVKMMKEKRFSDIRKWVAENLDSDSNAIFRTFYDTASEYLDAPGQAQLILLIAKYSYQAAFSVDHEICVMAFLTECMIELEYK